MRFARLLFSIKHTRVAVIVQIQFIDEDIDYSNRIGFSYVVVKRFGQQYALSPAFDLNKSLHMGAQFVDSKMKISTQAPDRRLLRTLCSHAV